MYDWFERALVLFNVKASDVSKATGISQATLSTWKKRDSQLKYESLLKIADYFGIDVSFFYTGDMKPQPKKEVVVQLPEYELLSEEGKTLVKGFIQGLLTQEQYRKKDTENVTA